MIGLRAAIALSVVYLASAQPVVTRQKVNMTVFYEALCPYSINFFRDQLPVVWPLFEDYLNIELVPYGFAEQSYENDTWYFSCQHGSQECTYNMYHACVLDKLPIVKAVNIIGCLMANEQEQLFFRKCTRKTQETKADIKQCSKGEEGRHLMSGYGNRTRDFQPEIKMMPSIVFNGVYNQTLRDDAVRDLKQVICNFLNPKPLECRTNEETEDYID
ncbi:gamma-interferon-inducible lysosomal thiol reductase [Nilaparvata lugens]|nr:gamma-interferon-inducible lysosomal thiol reductase [Nilaparvata lugens]